METRTPSLQSKTQKLERPCSCCFLSLWSPSCDKCLVCTCKEGMVHRATKRSLSPSPVSPSVCDDSVKVVCPVTFRHGCPFFFESVYESFFFFSAFDVHFQRLPQHRHTEMLSVLAVFFSYYLPFVRAVPFCPSWLTRKGWPLNNLKLTSYFRVSSTRVESRDPCLILVHLLFSLPLGAGVCGLATELWVSSKELRHESRIDGILERREAAIGGGEKGVQEDGEKAGGGDRQE